MAAEFAKEEFALREELQGPKLWTIAEVVQAALDNLDASLTSNPAWSGLTAIQNGEYFILPQELFHYKPNARWSESYAHLLDLLAE